MGEIGDHGSMNLSGLKSNIGKGQRGILRPTSAQLLTLTYSERNIQQV